jgi:hypothetical protein
MLKLAGGTHFLVLCRSVGRRHRLWLVRRFDDALSKWEAGARLSPLISLNGAEVPSFTEGTTSWLLFAGPVFPGDLDIEELPPQLFLSLGLYNVVLFTADPSKRDRAKKYISDHDVPWEEWQLNGHDLVDTSFSPKLLVTPSFVPASMRSPPVGLAAPALLPAAREYVTVIASTYGRSQLSLPTASQDIVDFDETFKSLVADQNSDPVLQHALYVNANAAISRHSSQTYAGTSPIVETECHFFTHALLGIGIASLALIQIRRFVEHTFARQRVLHRLKLSFAAPPHASDLLGLPSTSDYWDSEHLFTADIDRQMLDSQTPMPAHPLPLITCFSGRDGFRSTNLSLSAPLEVITACNTSIWTPLTLTHEISHTLVDGALGALFQSPVDSATVVPLSALIAPKAVCRDTREQLLRLLCHTLWVCHGPKVKVTAPLLLATLQEAWGELNEILTHVFDFLYFYDKDPARYIESIWASWGVIPNIQNRVPAYVLRTLCAIHAMNLRQKGGLDITIDQASQHLARTQNKFSHPLIAIALDELKQNRKTFHARLRERAPYVKFVRAYLYQPRIAAELRAEVLLGGGDKEGYPQKANEFESIKLTNPLRFITAFADGKDADAIRSAWLLTQLAFGDVR